jgi:hypothetical protein
VTTPVRGAANPERSFGLSVGGVLCLIAAVLFWRTRFARAEVLGAAGMLLVVLALAAPRLLRRPSVLWWRFSRLLGHVNARVLLTLLFALVLTPVGIFWRLTGRDPLARRRSDWPGWTAYPPRYRDPHHYKRMF